MAVRNSKSRVLTDSAFLLFIYIVNASVGGRTCPARSAKAITRQRVTAANLRARIYAAPYDAAKNKKPLTSNEISGFWQG